VRSKNKPAPTVAEQKHIKRIAEMDCAVCWLPGPSEVHEPEQGLWFLSIPLCADCHRHTIRGLHGQRMAWKARKMTELLALNETLRKVFA
jgi:hypothetical protein